MDDENSAHIFGRMAEISAMVPGHAIGVALQLKQRRRLARLVQTSRAASRLKPPLKSALIHSCLLALNLGKKAATNLGAIQTHSRNRSLMPSPTLRLRKRNIQPRQQVD